MRILTRSVALGLSLLAGVGATAQAQYYDNYYGSPNTYSWSPYNYPGYQTTMSGTPQYYNYPIYNYYQGSPYPAPKAYWDPYVAQRPYSDNAGPRASGH